MKKLVTGSAIFAGFVALAIAAAALATPSSGVVTTTLASGTLDPININVKTGDWKAKLETKGTSDVIVVENRVSPGGQFGWHSHPGPSLVIVKSGTSTLYDGDDPTCAPHVYPAGSAYVDSGDHTHIARNEGSTDLVLIVARLLPQGAPARIDQPNPGNCPF
jgi:quercetin dioxygenase-like cupin family protein